MPPTSGDLWGAHLLPDSIELEVLLPNGFIIRISITRETTIRDVKESLWQEAKCQPLFHLLEHKDSYIMVGLTMNGEEEEFYDESRRIYELRLGVYSMRIVMPKGNKTENILNSEVGQCIGISVSDLNKMTKLQEIASFRHMLLQIAQENTEKLLTAGTDYLLTYMYGGTQNNEITHRLNIALQNIDNLCISVVMPLDGVGSLSNRKSQIENSKHSIKVTKGCSVRQTIEEIIRTLIKCRPLLTLNCEDFVLKCCCTNTYMLNLDDRLINSSYIQRCLITKKIPIVQAVLRSDLYEKIQSFEFSQPSHNLIGVPFNEELPRRDENTIWDIADAKFHVLVKCGQYVCSKEACKLYVRCGIYHGSESIVPHCTTNEKASGSPYWNEKIEFNIKITDLPRAARLCLALIQRTEKKNKSIEYPVGWANLNLFDYIGRFVKGSVLLPLTPHSQYDDNSTFLNPNSLSSNFASPNASFSDGIPSDTVCLSLEFLDLGKDYFFPHENLIIERGKKLDTMQTLQSNNSVQSKIKEIICRDPLSDISEQEKEFLWASRDICCRFYPSSLPRLAQSVKWYNVDDVAMFYNLVNQWKLLEIEEALELLGCNYMNPYLRHFAVYCLDERLNDESLGQYLLQLTQTLKCEPYLENDLTEFLLRRSLHNIDLALPFFWYLRSEIHLPASRTRFGFLLEALCRGCGPLLKDLFRQTEVVDQLSTISEFVKLVDREEEQFKVFKEKISRSDVREMIEDFTSPLDKNHEIGKLRIESCEIKKSKKRPLWLVWENPDPLSRFHLSEYKLIFKHGDDLRQDMLTLQILRLMDKIWDMEGLDMQLVPYGCLATGHEKGIIEAVNDAQTVMSIQKKQFKSAIQIDPSQLHRWLQERNPGKLYETAINNFTKSCAAYCVATFILGIRDRHPDNIMLNKSGQLFHIDFGHFLNNRKKKFGINRERVPFILTEDFVFVIAKGADKPYKSLDFRQFMHQCVMAYLKLRSHAKLFLTLFTMMIPCGIPELTSVTDLEYLRKTLAVEMTEIEAVEYFNSKFCEAYNGAWTTKMDWFSHWVRN